LQAWHGYWRLEPSPAATASGSPISDVRFRRYIAICVQACTW
jgi:hypothetical protein